MGRFCCVWENADFAACLQCPIKNAAEGQVKRVFLKVLSRRGRAKHRNTFWDNRVNTGQVSCCNSRDLKAALEVL